MKPSKTASPNVAVEWGLSLSLLRRSWISGDACAQSTVLWTSNLIQESRTYPPGFRNGVKQDKHADLCLSAEGCYFTQRPWAASFGRLSWKEAEGGEEKPVAEGWAHVTPCDFEQRITWPGTWDGIRPCKSPQPLVLLCPPLAIAIVTGSDFSHSPSPTMSLPYWPAAGVCAGKAPCPLCLANFLSSSTPHTSVLPGCLPWCSTFVLWLSPCSVLHITAFCN